MWQRKKMQRLCRTCCIRREKQWKWGCRREANDHETRKQSTWCLISSTINYKWHQTQPWILKIAEALLLGPPSLLPTKVISFHILRVNMPVGRQTVFAWQLHYSPCSIKLSTHPWWKQRLLKCNKHIHKGTNETAHTVQSITQFRKKYVGFSSFPKSHVSQNPQNDLFYSKHSPS